MGKRSKFKRKPRDNYRTPLEAVRPLLPFLGFRVKFDEPCSGDGALVEYLKDAGHHCVNSSDICRGQDAMDITGTPAEMFITNPPWAWYVLDPLITHLSDMRPTFLLLNADLMHNKRMGRHMKRCSKVVSVGRIKWIEGSKNTGMENCVWMLFEDREVRTVFYGRSANLETFEKGEKNG
jgi:hypothetical protein